MLTALDFDPRHLYASLYRDVILAAQERNGTQLYDLVELVENHMADCFEMLSQTADATTANIHRVRLQQFQKKWNTIYSTSTCLSCLRRRPQYSLPCGHSVCENCVIVFGECSVDDPWIYELHRCWLCGETTNDTVSIRVQPPTAGANGLCIDGGGARGIIPLQLLKRIQDRVGLPLPLQRFFKVAFGVSSGMSSKTWKRSVDKRRGPHSLGTFQSRSKYRDVFAGV